MTFKQLLTARDEALGLLTEAEATLTAASEAFNKATADHEFASNAVDAANEAIRERLADKGHHSVQATDGTFTVYHVSDKAEIGWAAYQPVQGDVD